MIKKLIFALVVTAATYCVTAQNNGPSFTRGKQLYTDYCLTCHQDDGAGVPKLNPSLINSSFVSGDKKKIISWVLQGTTDKIAIDGKFYSNNMPAQNYLTDQQIADVLTFIRGSFGNKYSAISPADVKAIRAGIK